MRWGILAAALLLAACGGGSGGGTIAPPPVTIADLSAYLAQTHCPDGSPPLGCSGALPQQASDKMAWRRWDGQDQYEDSVVAANGAAGGAYWETTWSYPPHGPFVVSNGDGGEIEVSDGTTVSICCTQDGGQPGIQRFPSWSLYNAFTIACSQGWTAVDAYTRACEATVTYPASGYGISQIIADTIVSEHYGAPGYSGDFERFYMARGWGRLCWTAHSAGAPRDGMAPSCGDGAPAAATAARDRRLITNLVPMTAPLASVDDYGWPPDGFTP